MKKKIGFIGYGLRSLTMMNAFRTLEAEIEVTAITDPRAEEIKGQVANDPYFANTRYYTDADDLLANAEVDGVFIGTRCGLHTPLACKVLEKGIPLFLEKPVSISRAQYEQLRDAAKGKEDSVVVSFPLRLSGICLEVKRIVDSGELGEVTQVQAINNVPYGRVYYDSWYRDPNLTGGLFLQKATHDIDYINFIISKKPLTVCAQTAKLYYKGNKPVGLTCKNCEDYYTCVESSYTVTRILKEDFQGDSCCFAVDTGNEDVASAIFTYEDGVIVSYSQNFIAKKSAARRGARVLGTKGAVEFDWYTGEIRVDRYLTPQTIVHKFDSSKGAHFGGDESLALEFITVMNGEKGQSNLAAGLTSVVACLAAKESAEEKKYVEIQY